MITRIWHGKTKKEHANIYKDYVEKTGIKDYLKSDGILNAQILQKNDADGTHILTVTKWDNYESIKKFAGENCEKAKYYPDDEKYLNDLEENVTHYETFEFSNNEIKNYIKQFENLYNGDNWTDETFVKKLRTINDELAFKQPAEGKHSIAEVLWHLIFWKRVILKRMEGDWSYGRELEEEQNFLSLEILKERGWQNLKNDFEDINNLLIKILNSKNDDFLDFVNPNGYSNRYMIEGIIAHDYYHLGQIGLINALLN